MGFTVVGLDHFLGSGHPEEADIRGGQPARLGLIESTAGGATWTNVSPNGEFDFHAIADSNGRVYGWDSGTGGFMVSTDRSKLGGAFRGWHLRLRRRPVRRRPRRRGRPRWRDRVERWWRHVVRSRRPAARRGQLGTDRPPVGRGARWASLPRAVRLGAHWCTELPGRPQALPATADTLYAAVHDSDDRAGIYRSTDGGTTWGLRCPGSAP